MASAVLKMSCSADTMDDDNLTMFHRLPGIWHAICAAVFMNTSWWLDQDQALLQCHRSMIFTCMHQEHSC